jgi:signal transduction histidine kinase/ligand-binding sensor domain-containing protein
MGAAHGRRRDALALGTVLAGMLLAGCPCAFALDASLDISQYAHRSWKVRDGFTKGTVNSIVQTPDGYLWLGTEFGLLRFDGVRAVPWQPPPGQHLPSNRIFSLLAARDGTLWIGTSKGLAGWKGGKLIQYPALAGQMIHAAILEDHEGTIWVGGLASPPPGKLCTIQKGSIECYGEDGTLGNGVSGLSEDRNRNLWVGVRDGLWRWKPGPPTFYPAPGPAANMGGIQGLVESDDGALLFGPHSGISRLVGEKTEAYPLPGTVQQFTVTQLLRYRDGSLWIGTSDAGLIHLHRGRTDVFSQAEGLSGDFITALFTDREGTIWVATDAGLNRFREAAAATLSLSQGLLNASILSVLADRDGSVWLATRRGLNRWNNGQITIFGQSGARSGRSVPGMAGNGKQDGKLNGTYPGSMFQDSRGRIWVSTIREFGYLENGRFISLKKVPGGVVYSITEDAAGNLWIANKDLGLIHLLRDGSIQQIPWAGLGHNDPALALAADPLRHGLWVGFYQGGLAYFADGQVRASYSAADGLGGGRVNDLRFDPDGTLWAGTERGLSRVKNGRVATLTSKSGLPCDSAHWVMEDNAHSFWLYTACGLVRIARSELEAWAAVVDAPPDKAKDATRTIHATVFDSSDGVRSLEDNGGYTPHAAKSSDGRLWFLPSDGVSAVDPSHVPFNRIPPPVHIEQITADRKTYAPAPGGSGPLPLPPQVRDLEIDYTALSLVAPEKVLFRYKLEGWDLDWQDAGTRRQAFYTNLSPRNYRFSVSACNNSGLWNEAGTFLDFVIAPAYYQTTWFRLLCVAAPLGLLWALYRFRLHQATREFNVRVEERVGERTRIARDLHDTLLQSLAGVSLQLDGVSKQALRAGAPSATISMISRIREQVDAAFREARGKVWNLRSPTLEGQGLDGALRQLVERIAPATTARCDFAVSGEPIPCSAEIEEELLRIAQEAANNANRHSQASEICIALEYSVNSLTLTISDNGQGFDLQEGSRKSGHWGLKNMQERAEQIRGTCKITTAIGQGTRIEIRVPLSPGSLRNTLAKHAHSSSDS